jgi:hypothetical protein
MDDADSDSTSPPLTLSDIYGDEDLLQPPPHGSIMSAASANNEDDAASLVKEALPASSPVSWAASLGVGSATCSVEQEHFGRHCILVDSSRNASLGLGKILQQSPSQ